MPTEYSTMQKLSLAGMAIGSLMCLVGACAPYWIISDPQNFGELDLVGKLVKGSLGLFMYCVEAVGESSCRVFDMDNDSGWFQTARMGAAVCVLVGCVCGGSSLCVACCRCCRRFIVLGILSIISAAAGVYCVAVFSRNTESFTGSILGFQVSSYGWAYYLFTAGVATLGLVAFTACFSAPNSPLRGLVLTQAPANQVIVSTSTTTTGAHHPYTPLQNPISASDPGLSTHNGY